MAETTYVRIDNCRNGLPITFYIEGDEKLRERLVLAFASSQIDIAEATMTSIYVPKYAVTCGEVCKKSECPEGAVFYSASHKKVVKILRLLEKCTNTVTRVMREEAKKQRWIFDPSRPYAPRRVDLTRVFRLRDYVLKME